MWTHHDQKPMFRTVTYSKSNEIIDIMSTNEHLNEYEYSKAVEMHNLLESQPLTIREKMIEIIMNDICIHCSEINNGLCHCMNDE